jgi:hypothetical protein
MTPAGTRRRSLLLFALAALGLGGGFLYLTWIRAGEPLALDQALFACFGRFVPDGRLPYRDIFDSKPPLFLYTWVLGWAFGRSVTAFWWFEAVWLAGTMGLAGALAARLWGRWAGLLAAAFLFTGLWAPGFGGYWSRAQAEELMAPALLGAAWLALAAGDRPRLAVWAGVLTGVAGLYKIPAMAVAAAWPLAWLAHGSPRAAARRTAWMAAGLLAPWLAAALWFAAHGALGDFSEGAFVYHRHNAAFIAPPWGEVLAGFGRTLGAALPALLLAAAAGLAGLFAGARRQAAWLTPFVVLTLAAVVLQRQLAGYQFLLPVPALALAGAGGVVWLARGLARGPRVARGGAALALAAVALLGARAVPDWQRAYRPGAAYRRGKLPREAYLHRFQTGPFSPAVEEEAGRYVRAHTAPGDGILVWGLSPGIYVHADRHPVTRYPFHKILMTDAPLSRLIPGLAARRADLMRRLRADPPAYILVGHADQNGFEPEDSATSLVRFEELRDFVAGGYRPERRIGRFALLRRAPADGALGGPP